jgi:hypothetical protein
VTGEEEIEVNDGAKSAAGRAVEVEVDVDGLLLLRGREDVGR